MNPRFFANAKLEVPLVPFMPEAPQLERSASDPTPTNRLKNQIVSNIQIIINNPAPLFAPARAVTPPPAIEADDPADSCCERASSCFGGLVHKMVCGS
jgi:hypothetical protein